MGNTRIEYKPCVTEDCPGPCEQHVATDANGVEYKAFSFICPLCGAGAGY